MTVRFRRPGARKRSAARTARAAAALIAGVVAVAVLLTSPASASTTPSPAPTAPSAVQTFTLSPLAGGIVAPGDALSVSVTLENDALVSTAAPVEVTLAVGTAVLTDRQAVRGWLEGTGVNVPVTAVGTVDLPAVAAQSEQTAGITVAADDPVLSGREPGVYPLVASYEGRQGPVTSTSVMTIPPATAVPASVGVIVPITAPALSTGLLTSSELAALTAPDGSLSDQLGAVEGTGAILAIDPAIPAAIRVLGSAAPERAVMWLERLEALPNPRFALQFADADLAVQLQAGLPRPAQPNSLQAYMNPEDFLPEDSTPNPGGSSATPAPTASPATGEPDLPSTQELLDVGADASPVYWPAAGTTTTDVVTTLGSLTDDDAASLTIVSSSATIAGADDRWMPAHATADDADLLVYDEAVSSALHAASVQEQPVLRGAPLAAAGAYLSFAVADADGRPLLVTLGRAADRSRVALRPAITAVTTTPGVTSASLAALTGATADPVTLTGSPPEDARVTAASALFADEAALARFATVLDDPTVLTGPNRAEVLQLLGNGWWDDPDGWSAAIEAHRKATRDDLDAVGILPPSQIQLLTSEAGMPVWVRNELAYPVDVVLYARSDDLRLEVQSQIEMTAAPQSNTRVVVPVEARVGSGEVTVSLQLRSRTFEPIGTTQYADVNVRADWEGIGIVALGVIGGGLLVFGLIRTVLGRRRRARDGKDSTDGIHPHDAPEPPSEQT